MKFTKLPEGTFKEMQMNAGILLDGFTPATGEIENILGATSGESLLQQYLHIQT